jgi:hypothetical protein
MSIALQEATNSASLSKKCLYRSGSREILHSSQQLNKVTRTPRWPIYLSVRYIHSLLQSQLISVSVFHGPDIRLPNKHLCFSSHGKWPCVPVYQLRTSGRIILSRMKVKEQIELCLPGSSTNAMLVTCTAGFPPLMQPWSYF